MIDLATVPAAATTKWWHGAVVYQIYPRSFADANGDGVGDLVGITAHLDHVASLGVDAIWLSPFFPSPMADFGYDISDYCGVDPIFGTLADFDALIDRAHALGLRVIIDQVYAHTSEAHAWFAASRASRHDAHADWYVWADPKPDGSPPSNWQSVFGGPAWTWDARRQQYYLHNFLSSQPQLNGHHPAVQDALLGVARFWLDRGVDGFRIDAINFMMHDPLLRDNPPAPFSNNRELTRPFDYQLHLYNQSHPDIVGFLERLRTLTDSYDDRFTVAEVGGDGAEVEMRAFTARGTRLDSAYGFNFLYADALTPALVRDALAEWPEDAGWPSWAFENHDAPRALSRWTTADAQPEFARVKLLLLVALRGNAFLYYGEELGLTQVAVPFDALRDPEAIANWPRTLNRDGARAPMPWCAAMPALGFSTATPWLPVGEKYARLAVDVQEADGASLLHLTRKLVAFRHSQPALMVGTSHVIEAAASLLSFVRTSGGNDLLCIFNLGAEAIEAVMPAGTWTLLQAVNDVDGTHFGSFAGAIYRRAT